MKSPSKVFVLFIILLCFSPSLFSQIDSTYNLLWRIEKENVPHKGYLFGTMHVADDRAFNFADSVFLALEECDIFAMEVHPDTLIRATYDNLFSEDTTDYFKDAMTEKQYNNFIERFKKENGFDFNELENKHPLTVSTFDEENKYKGKNNKRTFVDMHLFGIAKTLKKPIIGLEPIENQLESMFESSIIREKFGFKIDTTNQKREMDSMIEVYDKGNLDGLKSMLGSFRLVSPMMIKRNTDMTNTIDAQIKNNSIFSAVGAAHLMGKESIIEMLRKKGYTVTQVYSPFTGVSENYKVDPNLIPWDILTDVAGGYQIRFPEDFSLMDQNIPVPTDFGPDTISMKFKIYSDFTNLKNYIIGYNDFQIGYYLEGYEEMFTAIEEELKSGGTKIISSEDANQNGLKGKMYKLMMKEKYYAIMHIFFRGNRIYRFLIQNITEENDEFNETELVGSLKFLPYASGEIKTHKVQDLNLPYFNKYRIVHDSVDYDWYHIHKGFDYYADDPSTGNLYSISHYHVKDYFWTKNLDSLYISSIEEQRAWNDTLLYTKEIYNNNLKGYEAVMADKGMLSFKRYRYWFTDDQFLQYSVYSDSIGIFCENSNVFFDSKIINPSAQQRELTKDKTDIILNKLYATDTLVSNAAMSALQFNVFDSTHIEKMERALLDHYIKDSSLTEQNNLLMRTLFGMDTYDTKKLSQLFIHDVSNTDYFRSYAITELYSHGDTIQAIEALFDKPPAEFDYSQNVLSAFWNNKELTYKYFDSLKPLLKLESWKSPLISLISKLAEEDYPKYNEVIRADYNLITEDYDTVLDSLKKAESDNYIFSSNLVTYLDFFNSFDNPENKILIEKIDTTGIAPYLKNRLVISQIKNHIDVPQHEIDTLLKSDYMVFELAKVLIQTDRKEQLPDSLKSTKGIYSAKFKDVLYEYDIYPDETEYLGTIKKSNRVYKVYYAIEDYGDDKYCSLMIINETKLKGKRIYDDLQGYQHYLEECTEKSNWKKIAEEQLEEFETWF